VNKVHNKWLSVIVLTAACASGGASAQWLAATDKGPKIGQHEIDVALGMLPDAEKKDYLSSAGRISLLLERIALAKEKAATERGLTKSELEAVALERELAGFTLAKRLQIEKLDKAEADPKIMQARAKELYLIGHEVCTKPAMFASAHILVRTDTRSITKAVEKIVAAEAKLKAGASFAEVAATESEDTESAKNGGVLPEFSRADLDVVFAKEYFSDLKTGRISEPFQTRYGLHILRVDGLKSAESKVEHSKCEQALLKVVSIETRDVLNKRVDESLAKRSGLKLNDAEIAKLAAANAGPPKGSEAARIKEALKAFEQQRGQIANPAAAPAANATPEQAKRP